MPLTWAQVDFAGGFVRLEPGSTKNNEGRAFPLIPELRALLERTVAITRRCERAQARIIAPSSIAKAGRSSRCGGRSKTACRKAGRPEAVYRRYAIVAESDLHDAGTKLTAILGTITESAPLSDNSGTTQ